METGGRRLRFVFVVDLSRCAPVALGQFATTERFCHGSHGHWWQDDGVLNRRFVYVPHIFFVGSITGANGHQLTSTLSAAL